MRHLCLGIRRLGFIAAISFGLAMVSAQAAEPENYKTIDGVAVYLGLLPAEMIRGHGATHPEATMHGGQPKGSHVYHVTVALFDRTTNARITDAEVRARASGVGLAGAERALEPMTIADTVTYGNYFALPGQGTYEIQVEIRRPGTAAPLKVQFTYDHRIR
jgi:hypothetical protein